MSNANQVKIDKLIEVANKFGQIAQKVNESSKVRKKHAEDAMRNVDPAYKACQDLLSKFKSVSSLSLEYREKIESINSSMGRIGKAMEAQKGSIDSSSPKETQNNFNDFSSGLKKGQDSAKTLLEECKKIVEMDGGIIKKKEAQKRNIMQLQVITEVVLAEAQKAIDGSQSNLGRGKQLTENFQSVPKLIEEKNIDKLNELVKEANAGWILAEDVNKNSQSQLAFDENFNSFTQNLHDDSGEIEKSISEKAATLENMKDSTSALADFLKNGIPKGKAICDSTGGMLTGLDELSSINFDGKKFIEENNKINNEGIELTKKEVEYYTKLRQSVEDMTEATKYPIEGSGKNIENGKFLEEALKELIASISS